MAIKKDWDEIDTLWGEPLSQRARNWLWLCLRYYPTQRPSANLSPDESQINPLVGLPNGCPSGKRDVELGFLLMYYQAHIPWLKREQSFLKDEDLEWIKDSQRQFAWLMNKEQMALRVLPLGGQAYLNSRDYYICIIDAVTASLEQKYTHIQSLKFEWEKLLADSSYLNWFSGPEELERCQFAWEILPKIKGMTVWMLPKIFSSAIEVQIYFDGLNVVNVEKKSFVDSIRRSWNQKKYREKQEKKNVKQYNFVFAGDTNRNLDKIANQLGVSRTAVLEQLIKYAAKYGMPPWAQRSH